MHRPIARRHPPHPPLPNRAPRQPLALIKQADHDLASRAEPPPQLKHTTDRVAHLLVCRQADPAVLVAVQTDRQAQLKLPAGGLVAKPTIKTGADQVQLGLGERALQPQQHPVVEVARAIDPV